MDQTYANQSVEATNRTIVAMFDDAPAAERARAELERAGISSANVETHQRPTAAAADDDGESWWESLKRLFMPDDDTHTYREGIRRGGVVLIAHVSAAQNDRVIDLLENCGAVDVDERTERWRAEGWTPGSQVQRAAPAPAATAATGTTAPAAGIAGGTAARGGAATGSDPLAGETRIPIAREELRVGKREVGGGRVRVRAYTIERPVQEDVTLRRDSVEIERRPASGAAAAPGADPFRERTVEVEERREEAVVSKDARVEEELVVRQRAEEERRTIQDKVRETKVEVDDQRPGHSAGRRD
jgi:uncharacterized protein (TIGR02271 family)